MRSFKDHAGRTWTLAIHVTAIKRCRALAGVDLLGLIDDGFKGLGEFIADPIRLVDVLYVLCKDDAEKLGISDEDFGRAMFGDAIANGATAFLEEYTDFFQDPRVRAGLTKVLASAEKLSQKLTDHMLSQIDSIDIDSEAEKLISSSGISPVSSASTPDPSLSANST